jgi:hypothetical protein
MIDDLLFYESVSTGKEDKQIKNKQTLDLTDFALFIHKTEDFATLPK